MQFDHLPMEQEGQSSQVRRHMASRQKETAVEKEVLSVFPVACSVPLVVVVEGLLEEDQKVVDLDDRLEQHQEKKMEDQLVLNLKEALWEDMACAVQEQKVEAVEDQMNQVDHQEGD